MDTPIFPDRGTFSADGSVVRLLSARWIEAKITVMRTKEWGNNMTIVLYVITLIAVVVGVDILFFRHHFEARLIANIGIVLVFAAFYLRFLKRS